MSFEHNARVCVCAPSQTFIVLFGHSEQKIQKTCIFPDTTKRWKIERERVPCASRASKEKKEKELAKSIGTHTHTPIHPVLLSPQLVEQKLEVMQKG